MGRLSKEAWAKSSLKTEEVEVEELGGSVLVRELPASYIAEINKHVQLKQVGREQISSIDLETMERLKFAHGVIGDNDEQLFSEEEAAEIATKHGHAFKTVVEAIDKLSDIGTEGVESAEGRFQSGGVRKNGGPVSDTATFGSGRSDVPARTGAGTEDASG